MGTSLCLPYQTPTIVAAENKPSVPKRFTVTLQLSKLNKPRITVTDSTACITSTYSYATAQDLVKELASVVGMHVYTRGEVLDMLRELSLMTPEEHRQ
jgi:hypothetical protein